LKLIIANYETGGIFKYKIDQSFPKTSAMLKHLPNVKPAKTNAKAPAIIPAKKIKLKLIFAYPKTGRILKHKINQVILKYLLC
jgi:hypothetical protein